MPFTREQMIYKAVVALDESIGEYTGEKPRPTFALRFCLAYLYSQSDGNRLPYDEFWKALSYEGHGGQDEDATNYVRETRLRGCRNAIMKSVGMGGTPEVFEAVARGHRRGSFSDICKGRNSAG
ncbi:hypothetical protein [Sphingosinicella microcystinivorans]|nr:hypothetical protein [Sphingosinicella microcystinivorans]BBE33843.1 hypothetical protein SmB9_15010 [Sphingosinicella microcystinivorans]